MKKILLLADSDSPHTQKWALSLCSGGWKVGIYSIRKTDVSWASPYPNLQVFNENGLEDSVSKGPFAGKWIYFKFAKDVKKVIRSFNPDIVHAHYATSYGLLGALAGFHPFILSVWGSDVYDFPKKGFFAKLLLKYNLKKADKILSTSHVMAKETAKYTSKPIEVTPFGIDLHVFKPQKVKSVFNENDIVIGTIKSIEKKYGIDYLLRSFKVLKVKYPNLPLKLLIVGGGTKSEELFELAKTLDIAGDTFFTGKVSQQEVPLYHNMLSVYVALSVLNSESFGVAAIEASACEKPVVVSDVDGFREVVEHNVTGIIVPKCNIEEIVKAMEFFILDKNRSLEFGKNGRLRVLKLYNWEDNFQLMIKIYNTVFKENAENSKPV